MTTVYVAASAAPPGAIRAGPRSPMDDGSSAAARRLERDQNCASTSAPVGTGRSASSSSSHGYRWSLSRWGRGARGRDGGPCRGAIATSVEAPSPCALHPASPAPPRGCRRGAGRAGRRSARGDGGCRRPWRRRRRPSPPGVDGLRDILHGATTLPTRPRGIQSRPTSGHGGRTSEQRRPQRVPQLVDLLAQPGAIGQRPSWLVGLLGGQLGLQPRPGATMSGITTSVVRCVERVTGSNRHDDLGRVGFYP